MELTEQELEHLISAAAEAIEKMGEDELEEFAKQLNQKGDK